MGIGRNNKYVGNFPLQPRNLPLTRKTTTPLLNLIWLSLREKFLPNGWRDIIHFKAKPVYHWRECWLPSTCFAFHQDFDFLCVFSQLSLIKIDHLNPYSKVKVDLPYLKIRYLLWFTFALFFTCWWTGAYDIGGKFERWRSFDWSSSRRREARIRCVKKLDLKGERSFEWQICLKERKFEVMTEQLLFGVLIWSSEVQNHYLFYDMISQIHSKYDLVKSKDCPT